MSEPTGMSEPEHVPSPADVVGMLTADELIAKVREMGGRVLRMRAVAVFVITDNPKLAAWLLERGARAYMRQHAAPAYREPPGGHKLAPGGRTFWDLYIHAIPTHGEKTVWEAAGEQSAETVEATEFA